MVRAVATTTPETTVETVAKLMINLRISGVPERLLAELRKQEWANPTESNVVVSDGVVHFWGTVGSEGERRALRVVAENVPGVRGIEDHTISGPRYLTPLFPAS
jgi:hypothetical protein